jgi:hypothetical protein
MSQQAVERTLGKLITDEEFREEFFKDRVAAILRGGLDLSAGELDALSRIPQAALAGLARRLDDRICRLHVTGCPVHGGKPR